MGLWTVCSLAPVDTAVENTATLSKGLGFSETDSSLQQRLSPFVHLHNAPQKIIVITKTRISSGFQPPQKKTKCVACPSTVISEGKQ